jgi:hypothetical protein
VEKNYFLSHFMNRCCDKSDMFNLLSSYLVQYFVVLYFNDEDESLCYHVMDD